MTSHSVLNNNSDAVFKVAVVNEIWHVVLEKDGEDLLERSYEKLGSITQSQGGEEYHTQSKNWTGNILRRNCRMKNTTGGKKEEEYVTGIQGRKQHN